MNIVTVRRIAQVFFFALFLWLCVVTSVGDHWWQLRGWPVNWLLQLDPLVALGMLLTTKTLYVGLLWALLTIALTLFVGRFFCGWICPFGALHQFIGWLGRRKRKHAERVAMNQYRPAQVIKYYILIALLGAAGGSLLGELLRWPQQKPATALIVGLVAIGALVWLAVGKVTSRWKAALVFFLIFAGGCVVIGLTTRLAAVATASLQTGLLDPIPLLHRSVNLVVLTVFDGFGAANRFYAGGFAIAVVFFAAVLLNLWIPRFYCRFICPLGALFGLLVRWTPWRIGKDQGQCSGCELCENNCEGACDPFGKIHTSECLLCMNCLKACRKAHMTYGPNRSVAGEIESPAVSRRGFLMAAVTGVTAIPAIRLAGSMKDNWNSAVIRPPGALSEMEFIERCIKCGQCMRICPTNVIQPALGEAGLEGIWTPILNFRVGSSGCQLNCIACGNVCPTAAIRPLSFEEKRGLGEFAANGPVRMGTAFVDRGRCLPWAMDLPCIVCQENCPVSPKAIHIREEYQIVRDGVREVKAISPSAVELAGALLRPDKWASGDYFVRHENEPPTQRRTIVKNSSDALQIAAEASWPEAMAPGDRVLIEVRLQKPQVDPEQCIGCGICQHECPVSGLRAIRVTAENESRNRNHSLTTKN